MLVLSSDFIQPAADGSVYQAAASWYKSGATNALWEVDFAVMNNVLFIPQKRRDFVFQNTDYQNLYLQNGEAAAVLPTAIGGDTNVVIAGTALGESFDFRAFEGLGQDAVYHPYAQAAVGLPKGFELKVRYAPKIEINDSNFQILGLGLQSNLNALFGEHKNEKDLAMPLQVSALVAYANFKVDFLFDPFELPGASINSTIIAANTWLFQVVASKKIKRFDLFYALGFTRSAFEYELGGEKTLFLEALNAALTSLDTVQSDLKFDLGFNYNLNKFTLNNTFSFGKFANYNLGIYYTIN
jgi:hypothetical protein